MTGQLEITAGRSLSQRDAVRGFCSGLDCALEKNADLQSALCLQCNHGVRRPPDPGVLWEKDELIYYGRARGQGTTIHSRLP
jgi:hypothetical protein